MDNKKKTLSTGFNCSDVLVNIIQHCTWKPILLASIEKTIKTMQDLDSKDY